MNGNPVIKSNSAKIKKSKKIKQAELKKYIFILIFVGPPFIVYLILGLYPNVLSVWYSFLRWDGFTEPVFVGLDNYKKLMFDPFFYRALGHNVIYMLTEPVLITLVSVLLANVLINKHYRENSFYKVLYFFPNILASVVVALLWSFIYDGSFGLLNAFLRLIGIDVGEFYWLGDERTALWAIIPVSVWKSVGFYVVIFINAISSIPKSFYDYAELEGASSMTKLFKITLPLISGVIKVCALFLFLGGLKGFETILILTGGGPGGATDVVGLYMFNMAFNTGKMGSYAKSCYGYASTIGMFLFVILVIAKLIIDKCFKDDSAQY